MQPAASSASQDTLIYHARRLLTLGLPLVGATLAGFLIHMTDTLMLGWYDVTALAASVVANSLWFILYVVGAGFGYAVTPLVTEAVERGDDVRARRITRMGLWLSMVYCLLALALLWRGEAALLFLGQTPDVAALGGQYLSIAIWGFFFALGGHVMRCHLGALELTAVQLWVTLAALITNAVVNYALIFGNFGAPEMGIRGAAWASIFTHFVQMAALMAYAQWKRPDMALFQRIWKPDAEIMRTLAVLGVPIGLTMLAESGLFVASSIMMGWIGEIELAAHGIALQLTALAFMFHVGMSQAATIRAGSLFGRGDHAGLRRSVLASYTIAGVFGIAAVAVFVIFPQPLVTAFLSPEETAREAVIALGVQLMLLAALFQFVDAGQIIALTNLRGLQDTTIPMWLAVVSYWGIGMPASYVMAFTLGWGPHGLWLGLTVGLTCAALSLGWRLWRRMERLDAAQGIPA